MKSPAMKTCTAQKLFAGSASRAALAFAVALTACNDSIVTPEVPAASAEARVATLQMVASSTWLARGDSVTLSWYATNVTTCQGSWQDEHLPLAGSVQLQPAKSVTFAITCSDPSRSISRIQTIVVEAPRTESRLLAVTPIVQHDVSCCWTAAANMVLRYLGREDVTIGDGYLCENLMKSVVDWDCASSQPSCNALSPRSPTNLRVTLGYLVDNRRHVAPLPNVCGELLPRALSARELQEEIDVDRPMIVELTSRQAELGEVVRLHTAVIVGYDQNGSDMLVIVNDPYPFVERGKSAANAYLLAGGEEVGPGQYRLSFAKLMNGFTWERTIFRIR